MPKQVDYAARIQFVREAAFQVVLRRGVADLSRRSVAAVLGTSPQTVLRATNIAASLAAMAAAVVTQRRRHRRWHLRGHDALDTAHRLACSLLPDTPHRVPEELVWWRLVVDQPRPGLDMDGGDEDRTSLRQAFEVADRGWAEEATDTEGTVERAPDERLQRVIEDRAEHVQTTVTEILGVLEITDFDAEVEAITLHALLEGLNVNVCLGRLEPAAAVETARLHLVHVAARARAARVAG